MKELGLRYKWYRIGFEVSTKMQWWRLSNWFWHHKMDRFFLAYPQEADYDRVVQIGKLKIREQVIHNGW